LNVLILNSNISTIRKEKKEFAREKAVAELIAQNGVPKRRMQYTAEERAEHLLQAREHSARYRDKYVLFVLIGITHSISLLETVRSCGSRLAKPISRRRSCRRGARD
jgi:hypothetical protein